MVNSMHARFTVLCITRVAHVEEPGARVMWPSVSISETSETASCTPIAARLVHA